MKRDALTRTLLRAVLWSAIAGSILLPSSALSACNPGTLFDPAWFYQTANYAFCPVSADLNGDGITDIAVTCYFSNAVSLLFGLGDGSFMSPTNIPVGATARNLVAADVNGDGILDLVVTNVTPSTVTVLLGLGTNGHNNGQFAQPVAYPAGQENRGLAVTDLNGDGHPDLVVGGLTSVAILLNQNPGSGWGTFGPPVLYPQPWCWPVAVGDFNGDGLTDVAAGNWLTPELDILLGNGNGTFTAGAKITVPGGCSDIAVKDLDGDGILDLAVSGVGGIWVMRGNGTGGHGDGTFTLTPYAQLGHTFNGILVADFNGDENDDIVGTDTDGIQVLLLPGRGDGTFGEMDTYPVGTGPIMMTAFDANRDGLLDLMVACSASLGLPGAMAVMLGRCVAGPEPVLTAVRDVKNDQGEGIRDLAAQRAGHEGPARHHELPGVAPRHARPGGGVRGP